MNRQRNRLSRNIYRDKQPKNPTEVNTGPAGAPRAQFPDAAFSPAFLVLMPRFSAGKGFGGPSLLVCLGRREAGKHRGCYKNSCPLLLRPQT